MSEGYSVPIFFSETGCNVVPGGRDFGDQAAIFGPDMSNTWSGSIIYEWVQESNKYGLVNYPNGQIYSGKPIPIVPDYENLKEAWSNVKPVGVAEGAYKPSFSAPPCPAASGGWKLDGDVPIPTLSAGIVEGVAKQIAFTASATLSSTPISPHSITKAANPSSPSASTSLSGVSTGFSGAAASIINTPTSTTTGGATNPTTSKDASSNLRVSGVLGGLLGVGILIMV